MWGLVTLFAGVLVTLAGLAWLFGPWVLVVGGLVLTVVGLCVDLDRVKEPQRGKRSQSAP